MAITDLDEQLLVRAHQAGDEAAFGQIVRSQHRALYAHAYRRLGSHEAAEDAVQDTLLRAYRALPSFDGDLRLRAWLHRILTNVCHDEGNRRRRQAGLVDRLGAQPVELAPDPVEEAVLHDTVRVMSEALADLPESYREALVLRYVDGLSFREVAEVIGTTEENARARVHRGRQALQKIMSRLALIAAFVIPGMRRAQHATPDTNQAVDHASLITQLTVHATNAAPTVTRVAAEMSALPAGKSALVTGAIAAAAAVTVSGAAYTVHEVRTPEPRPPAVAAPLPEDEDEDVATATDEQVGGGGLQGDGGEPLGAEDLVPDETSTTVTTIPRSAERPFETPPSEDAGPQREDSATTTTTEAPPEAEPQPAAPEVAARLVADALDATGTSPNFDVSGPFTIAGEQQTHQGDVVGRLSFHDDSTMVAELRVTIAGVLYELRARGTVIAQDLGDEVTTYRFTGKFVLPGGEELGAPESGNVVDGTFRRAADGPSSLTLDLSGPE